MLFIFDSKRKSRFNNDFFFFKKTIIILINFKKMIYFFFARTIRQIRTLFRNVNYTNIKTFRHFKLIIFFLKRLMITFFELKIFIFIKKFALKLSITCMFLINLIMINFFSVVFFFIKKENVIYLFIKCQLKSISRRVIVNLYLFIIKKDISRFKNNLSFIFIKHFIFK